MTCSLGKQRKEDELQLPGGQSATGENSLADHAETIAKSGRESAEAAPLMTVEGGSHC